MAVGIEDCHGWVADGQRLTTSLTVGVVIGTTVDGEVGGLVDKRSSPGIGTSVVGVPEGTAEVDLSELVGIDVGVSCRLSASAVVGEVRELAAADQLKVALDRVLARSDVGTEPGIVSGRAVHEILDVSVSGGGIGLGAGGSGVDLRLSGRRAVDEEGPLVVNAGGGEVTRESKLSSILNSSKQVLGGAISIDIGEEVRWFDGIVSSAGFSEVVRLGEIMGDVDRSTRSENGENAGIIEAGGVFRAVLDLATVEQGAGASGIGDTEGVLGEGVQDSTGIVEEFEGLVAGVGDDRGDLQVLQPVDLGQATN